jgi:MFS family permease
VPLWARALTATLIVQTVSSFATFSVPLLGPLLTERARLSPESIGYISALLSAGICWFLASGSAMLNHYGPIRTLQIGLACSVIGLMMIAQPFGIVIASGALAVGFGTAPNTPAGSQILIRTAPPRHRSLIFSIKQAGVPLGGAIAGLIVAPVVSTQGLPATIALVIAVLLATICIVQPFRRALDSDRDHRRQDWVRSLLSWKEVVRSISSLRAHPSLPLLTALGASFSVTQACLTAFTATYLVIERGVSLADAGLVMAVMQLASMVGRIFMGWTADRTKRAVTHLAVQAMVSAVAVCLLAVSALETTSGVASWPLYASAALVGVTAIGWNGVHIAELARVSPIAQVSDVTSAASLFGFIGSIFGPLLFIGLVIVIDSYIVAFSAIAVQLAFFGFMTMIFIVKSRIAKRSLD